LNWTYLLRGFILGISIAAPVGPIGILCIRRTLVNGRLAGWVTGLGAATADAVFGCIAGFGLTMLANIFVSYRFWLQIGGGIFLCYLGVRAIRSKPADPNGAQSADTLAGAYTSTFFLTLTNPLTILSFAAVFAGLGLVNLAGNYVTASLFVLGVFIGSATWWLFLSAIVSIFRSRIGLQVLQWINWISGAMLAGFGVLTFVSAFT
jgi:threonine/homoserine/homoserine lactone efflux protein